ncbi:MAG TPA: DUF3572 domain-containing protein [Rhizomicrobium sp.]|jgi:hypothetical protein|nr:DUF3572 domain-containing protein [Rhizomicrobium sp.]
MTTQSAEILGLDALAWLAGDVGRLERFMNACGIERSALQVLANQPETIVAVVEFLLANEDLLVAFCDGSSIRPDAVQQAQRLLGGA